MTTPRRLAIIGGGPIGLEAALHARQRGFDVRVYERGRTAEHLHRWGHTRMFSPFGMNSSSEGRSAVTAAGHALPSADALLTGREYAELYLVPLSRLPALEGRIHEQTTVLGISRSRHGKRALVGKPERAADPFLIWLRTENGEERTETADIVFDCSGVFAHPNHLGAGGLPVLGEAACQAQIESHLPDLAGEEAARYAGRTTLILGAGYSAATTVVQLDRLAAKTPGTHIIWVTRQPRAAPLPRLPDDPLAERDQLAARANSLAATPERVAFHPNRVITRLELAEAGRVAVWLGTATEFGEPPGAGPDVVVDQIVANVGYRPDRTLYEELQVHECYASQGPMALAASLMKQAGGDCLAQTSPGANVLKTTEPGFFLLGAKSYGRDSRFLIRLGLEQIEQVLDLIAPPTAGNR